MVQVLITTVTRDGQHGSSIIAFFNTIEQADEAAKRINERRMSWATTYATVLN